MERCCGQAAMVHADHVNSWWGVELLIPLLKHTKYYYFCVKSMCRPMPTRGKFVEPSIQCVNRSYHDKSFLVIPNMPGFHWTKVVWAPATLKLVLCDF